MMSIQYADFNNNFFADSIGGGVYRHDYKRERKSCVSARMEDSRGV